MKINNKTGINHPVPCDTELSNAKNREQGRETIWLWIDSKVWPVQTYWQLPVLVKTKIGEGLITSEKLYTRTTFVHDDSNDTETL